MNYKKLGHSDLMVPSISFGGNVFGWTLNEKDSFSMLDELFEQGLNFIDTANNYSYWVPGNVGGESETIIGKWFKQTKKRHDIVLSTKVGGRLGDNFKGLKAANITQCVEDSLKRLNTDYIDLYFSHHDDLETPLEETMEAFNTLVQSGKVRYLGASNLEVDRIVTSNNIAKAQGWNEYKVIQPLYNLYDREKFETEYLPLVNAEELGVMSYFALASGFLSGKYRSLAEIENSPRKAMVEGYINERGLRIIVALEGVAIKYGVTLSEVAIAWQVHKPEITTPIVSTTSKSQLDSLIKAIELQLTSEDMALLDLASAY